MDESTIKAALTGLLTRKSDTNKYDFGHVLVIGGSDGMAGAPLLAGLAALRSGAGLVTLASEVAEALENDIPELMTHLLPPGDTDHAVNDLTAFMADRSVSVVIIGPGLSMASTPTIRQLVTTLDMPTILDAGGLTAFQENLEELAGNGRRNPGLILTPHSGEFQKLSEQSVAGNTKATLHNFATNHHVTVTLKGYRTLVASADSAKVYQNQTSNPGMATAGSGDVLTGVIAGLCGQGLKPFTATCAAVYLHGLAGDLAMRDKTQPGVIASDIIEYLPAAFASLV